MSFIEHAYRELKAIEPKITADEFSTKWLNKCSSYYRSYKSSDRDMTVHALLCLLLNLKEQAAAPRMNNQHQLLHKRANQYASLSDSVSRQLSDKISLH